MLASVIVISVATLALGALGGFLLLGAPDGRARSGAYALLALLLAAAPWALPADERFGRIVVALCVSLSVIRLWDTARRQVPAAAAVSLAAYVYYFVNLPETTFLTDPAQRTQARRAGLRRLGGGAFQYCIVVGLFALATAWPKLWAFTALDSAWCLLAAYCFCSGTVDLCAGLAMWLGGHGAAEVFIAPLLARSPRDFWGRRWNMTFRNAAHRSIFVPLRSRPVLAAFLVFAWSALVHEYLVVAALQSTQGHMAAFFLLHGVAAITETRFRRPEPLRRGLAIGLHWAWMLLTAPLFFHPLRQVVPVESYKLW